MYPFEEGQTFPREQWYIAACRHEVSRTLFERTILDERIVFYRTEAGHPIALHAICPHRNLPLVQGHLVGDSVRCGYHGFTFDGSGRCTTIPSQPEVPARFATRSFPVVEKGPWVWIWMGDPAQADPARLPDLDSAGLDTPGWRADNNGVRPLKARFGLLIDNLMDLSHFNHLHLVSGGGEWNVVNLTPEMIEKDGRVQVMRRLRNQPVDHLHSFLHPTQQGPINVELYSEFLGAGLVNAAGPHSSTADGRPIGKLNFVHGLTPETARSTHYFPAISRDFRLDDDGLTQMLLEQESRVIAEDIVALEAVEAAIDRHGNTRTELSAIADAGALRVRRRLIEMMRAEQR